MKKKDHSKTAGFTLIELLVVIAILAILVAVGIPVYTGYISRANDAAVSTELGAVLTAAEAANATNSNAIETITIDSQGVFTVKLEDDASVSTDYYHLFATFYGVEHDKNQNVPFGISALAELFQKSESYKDGVTWDWTTRSWTPNSN